MKAMWYRVRSLPTAVDPNLLILLCLSLFVWAPMVNDAFFFHAHDARHSVFYLVEFDQAIRDGAWYPRWGTDFALGYGYPLFDLYAPLSIYVGEAFHFLGLGYVEAVKATFALGWVLSALAMYGFARRLAGPRGGLLAAVIYTFVPYRIVDVYVRGVLAESFAFVFIPLVLWSFGELATGGRLGSLGADPTGSARAEGFSWRQVIFAGTSLAGLVLTHNGMALVFAPLVMIYCLYLLLVRSTVASRRPNLLAAVARGLVPARLSSVARGLVPRRAWSGGQPPALQLEGPQARERAEIGVGARPSLKDRPPLAGETPAPPDTTAPHDLEQDSLNSGEEVATATTNLAKASPPMDGTPRRSIQSTTHCLANLHGRPLLAIGAAGILALGLSAIFWLPMLAETKYVAVDQWTAASFDFKKHFLYFFQYFSPFWGFGYSGEGIQDEMPFQLGVAVVTIAVFAAVAALRRSFPRPLRYQVVFFFAATIIACFSMLGLSAVFWDHIPAASFVQFPWRLLALTAITTAVLAGTALAGANSQEQGVRGFLTISPLLALVVLASYNYLAPQYTPVQPENVSPRAVLDFETFSPKDRVGMTRWVTEQPTTSPLVEEYLSGAPLQKAKAADPQATVEMLHHGGQSEAVHVSAPAATELIFYTYYFPGWSAQVDGTPVSIYPSTPQALITLQVPAGEHQVSIRFEDTPVRRLGTGITLVTLIVLAAFYCQSLARLL